MHDEIEVGGIRFKYDGETIEASSDWPLNLLAGKAAATIWAALKAQAEIERGVAELLPVGSADMAAFTDAERVEAQAEVDLWRSLARARKDQKLIDTIMAFEAELKVAQEAVLLEGGRAADAQAEVARLREALEDANLRLGQRGVLIEQYVKRTEHVLSAVHDLQAVSEIEQRQAQYRAALQSPTASEEAP